MRSILILAGSEAYQEVAFVFEVQVLTPAGHERQVELAGIAKRVRTIEFTAQSSFARLSAYAPARHLAVQLSSSDPD